LIVERLLAILKIHNPAADVNAFRTDIKKTDVERKPDACNRLCTIS